MSEREEIQAMINTYAYYIASKVYEYCENFIDELEQENEMLEKEIKTLKSKNKKLNESNKKLSEKIGFDVDDYNRLRKQNLELVKKLRVRKI